MSAFGDAVEKYVDRLMADPEFVARVDKIFTDTALYGRVLDEGEEPPPMKPKTGLRGLLGDC